MARPREEIRLAAREAERAVRPLRRARIDAKKSQRRIGQSLQRKEREIDRATAAGGETTQLEAEAAALRTQAARAETTFGLVQGAEQRKEQQELAKLRDIFEEKLPPDVFRRIEARQEESPTLGKSLRRVVRTGFHPVTTLLPRVLRAEEAQTRERVAFLRPALARGRRQSLLASSAGTSSSLRLGQPTLLG